MIAGDLRTLELIARVRPEGLLEKDDNGWAPVHEAVRQGRLDKAEHYLSKALELYIELYGERAMHMNVAGVKFQQGALAAQREQLEEAWLHFSECLRIRRHVYSYAQPIPGHDDSGTNPLHLEVSCVLHELGAVAFLMARFLQAKNLFLMLRRYRNRLNQKLSMHCWLLK